MTTDNVTEFEFNPDAVDQIDQDSVEQTGARFPIVQWCSGAQKMRKAGGMEWFGGFFIKDGAIDAETLTANGWTKTSMTHADGSETEGWTRREMAVSVIAYRQRWEVRSDSAPVQVFPWTAYNTAKELGRPSGKAQVLVLVKGLESIGPVVLTFSGTRAVSFLGSNKSSGALTKFAQTVITAANFASDSAAKKAGKPAGKHWPYRAFWLPVGANRDAKGDPLFSEVGVGKDVSHVVLPVALGLPDKPDQVDLKKFYCGNELLQTVNDLYVTNADWRMAWDNIIPGATDNGATVAEATESKATDDAVLSAAGL